jgi:hypothetical protein
MFHFTGYELRYVLMVMYMVLIRHVYFYFFFLTYINLQPFVERYTYMHYDLLHVAGYAITAVV